MTPATQHRPPLRLVPPRAERDARSAPALAPSISGVRPALGHGAGYARAVDAEGASERDGDARTTTEPDGQSPAAPSLEALYRQHSAYVAGIAHRLLGRDGDVDDVVQDVFLSAWKGLGALRDPGALKGWLATVTVRIARRKLRMRRLKQVFRLDDEPGYENVPAPGASPEEKVLLARVYVLLDRLPVEQRLAWTLRFVERQQLDDVARLCGCSLATAKRRIGAAQAALDGVIHD